MTTPKECLSQDCDNYVKDKRDNFCEDCYAKIHGRIISDAKKSSEDSGRQIPSYYGGGKGWDSYKYATFHNFPPALAHAHKYITRAGKKKGESYEEAIDNAIHALKRDLEIRRELNG